MTPLNINGLKFVRTWDSSYFIILLMNFTPCSPSQTRDALGKFVKKAIVHYRDDLDLQNLMDSIQKEVFPRPLPLHESTFGCCATCHTNVFTACRMGTVKPGRPLRPWASEPSVILAPAREISGRHAPSWFLCAVGPHIRYRTPICTAWHACEPGFSHGRSPRWQDVRRERAGPCSCC